MALRRADYLRRASWCEPGILVQHSLFQLLQLLAWLEPDLLAQRLPGALIRLEGIRLSTVPVESEHELAVGTLAQWLCGNQLLELGYEQGVASSGQVGVDPFLENREACFLQLTGSVLGEQFVAKIGKGLAAPDRQRVAKNSRVAGRAAFLRELLEAVQVELALLEAKTVTGRLGYQPVLPERSAKLGHAVLKDLRGRRRRALSPKSVDQSFGWDEFVRMQQEVGEERKLLPTLKYDGTSFVDNFEWS